MADDTIFHRIIRREIPADIVHEDEHVIAFRDISPQALVLAAAAYARREGIADDGYRMVMNCNDDGGQTVFQLHLHLLGGAPLGGFGSRG